MQNVQTLIVRTGELVGLAVPVVMGIALLGFFWGLAVFIFHAGDENKVEEGKNIMKWGLIALFLMAAVWGIVSFMMSALGLEGGGVVQIRPI